MAMLGIFRKSKNLSDLPVPNNGLYNIDDVIHALLPKAQLLPMPPSAAPVPLVTTSSLKNLSPEMKIAMRAAIQKADPAFCKSYGHLGRDDFLKRFVQTWKAMAFPDPRLVVFDDTSPIDNLFRQHIPASLGGNTKIFSNPRAMVAAFLTHEREHLRMGASGDALQQEIASDFAAAKALTSAGLTKEAKELMYVRALTQQGQPVLTHATALALDTLYSRGVVPQSMHVRAAVRTWQHAVGAVVDIEGTPTLTHQPHAVCVEASDRILQAENPFPSLLSHQQFCTKRVTELYLEAMNYYRPDLVKKHAPHFWEKLKT